MGALSNPGSDCISPTSVSSPSNTRPGCSTVLHNYCSRKLNSLRRMVSSDPNKKQRLIVMTRPKNSQQDSMVQPKDSSPDPAFQIIVLVGYLLALSTLWSMVAD